MRRLTKRERNLVIVVILFAVIGLFTYYYYFPLEEKIENLRKESEELSLDIDDAKVTEILVVSKREEKKILEEESKEYEEYLMESIDEPLLLTYIEDVVIDDTEEQSLSYSELVNNELYFHKDVSLSFNTEYESLNEILKEFEEGYYYNTLNSISISSNYAEDEDEEDEEDKDMPLSVSYSLRFYGADGTWDGTGEYEFMDGGKFGRDNPFTK